MSGPGVNYDDLYEEFLILTSSSYSSSDTSPIEKTDDPVTFLPDSPATSPLHHFESISPLRVVSSIDPMMSTVSSGRSVSPWNLQDKEDQVALSNPRTPQPHLQLVDEGLSSNNTNNGSDSTKLPAQPSSCDWINNNSGNNDESPHLRAQLTQQNFLPSVTTSNIRQLWPPEAPRTQPMSRGCWNDNQRLMYHQIRPVTSTSSIFNITNSTSNSNHPLRPSWFNPNEALTNLPLRPVMPSPRPLWLGSGEPPLFPGGLEVLWREMPNEYQKLITPQDVPETARFRGYFTVCELLALKRSLQAKFPAYAKLPVRKEYVTNENKRKDPPTIKGGNKKSCSGGLGETTVVKVNKRGIGNQVTKQPQPPAPATITMINNHVPTSTTGSNNVDLVGAVKEALRVLDDDGQEVEIPRKESSDDDIREEETKIGSYIFRTTTIVLKLLQIGNFHFRSFTENHPNRLRVLFNTQKITYECQLPIFRPVGGPGCTEIYHPLRKILLVTINFDQITMVQFGDDKLFLRVDGPPFLTVTYSQAGIDEGNPPNLTPQEQYLLEQIDKGQLKLMAYHQLFFINHRMVTALENQFKEHPKFRNIMTRIP